MSYQTGRAAIGSALRYSAGTCIAALLAAGTCWSFAAAVDNDAQKFDSPADAVKALLDATKARDKAAVRKIFGSAAGDLGSGDDVEDAADFEQFAKHLAEKAEPVPGGEGHMILHIGRADFPFAIPLVKGADGKWFFDTAAGKEELINRRVGENELTAIGVCRVYVEAQREYAAVDRNNDGIMEYAQKFRSTPGKKDGLVWDAAEGEPLSPLGPLLAQAHAEGYGKTRTTTASAPAAESKPHPFHGYLFKILTKQGEKAPGGKFDYIIHGHMLAGFALVAYPAEWGRSGVMTFIVNANGKVYQKNLGEKSAELARAMDEYNPDESWALVADEAH